MSTITKQWLQQKIADMEAARDEIPFGLDEDSSNTLAALRIALASLEADAVCVIDQSNLDYLKSGSDADVWPASRTEMGDVLLYRAAPPAPVSVPDALEDDIDSDDHPLLWSYNNGWNACRAAMLQGAEQPHRAKQNIPKNIPFEQWLSQQTDTIDVDCGCVTTEVFSRWLRVAYEAGNSPVIPDGWVACSERMPEREIDVQVYCSDKNEQMVGYMERNERDGYFRFSSLPNGVGIYCQPTHWMPLPAAPDFREIGNSSTKHFRENSETSTNHSRDRFISLCNQFWNWQEFDEINAGEEEPRLEWDGKEFTHRVTQALWRMYQAAAPQQEA